ncbi:MAG: dynamin family protein [Acidimicrobiia bacterium]
MPPDPPPPPITAAPAATTPERARLVEAAATLRDRLAAASFPLPVAGREAAEATAEAAVRQLDDYVIARLADLDAPALIVVGGSTGAGKSTLINSLLGTTVTRPGVLRPTTRAPVLVHHPSEADRFSGDRVLPALARVSGGHSDSTTELELVALEDLPPTVALLDTPDIDSVVDANRELAAHLLAAADLWVFVTTAARYADAVPWQFLLDAQQRGVALVVVLNRVPPGALEQITAHLAALLAEHGLGGTRIFGIEEQPLRDAMVGDEAIAPLRAWLRDVATDHEVRTALVRQTLRGTVAELVARTERVAAGLDDQRREQDQLLKVVHERYRDAAAAVGRDIREGALIRGEVLARWQDLIGTGDLGRLLQSTLGRLRERLGSLFTGRAPAAEGLHQAVESATELVVRARADEAAAAVAARWAEDPAGEALLAAAPAAVDRASPELGARAERLVRDWQAALVDNLREKGAGKRSAARALSYGVNGLALVVMMAVFASTGGLTGTEAIIAGGSSTVGAKLLEALLGDQVIRRLVEEARADLDRRVDELMAHEADRFRVLVRPDPAGGPGDDDPAAALRAAAAELARRMDGRR